MSAVASISCPIPADEPARLAALRELAILDTDPEPVYDDVVRLASAICGTPVAVINFVDAERQWGKALVGVPSTEAPREHSFCARTILNVDGTLVVPDTLLDPEFSDNPMVTGFPRMRFYAGATVCSAEGHALGTVCVADDKPRTLDEQQIEALRILARQTASHLELRRRSAQLEEANGELRRLAVEDGLTGLPNRTLLFDRLDHALRRSRRSGRPLGVLFCDLDGFKAVNDEHGHAAGDEMLRAVARRLLEASRAGDTVARLAGDEFVVVCPELESSTALDDIARRIARAVGRPLRLGNAELRPVLSIGASVARDRDVAEDVLQRSDQAMYAEKAGRRAAA